MNKISLFQTAEKPRQSRKGRNRKGGWRPGGGTEKAVRNVGLHGQKLF
ncbi:hypothetical protein B4135_2013 [Caldibacillus debilis]|uniref:Uncharacterized protein n=1 Tax=Caldibacillus debilis TaxID=301148 RepID=A0A150M6P1_9BACI|nr:hypothetical protein B4135_2013 [Caldibacillus debilis]